MLGKLLEEITLRTRFLVFPFNNISGIAVLQTPSLVQVGDEAVLPDPDPEIIQRVMSHGTLFQDRMASAKAKLPRSFFAVLPLERVCFMGVGGSCFSSCLFK